MDKIQYFLDNKKNLPTHEILARLGTLNDQEKLLLEKELDKSLLDTSKSVTIEYKKLMDKKRLELGDAAFEQYMKDLNK